MKVTSPQELKDLGVTEELCDVCHEIKSVDEFTFVEGTVESSAKGLIFNGRCICRNCRKGP